MITITLPIWLTYLITGVLVLSAISTLFDFYIKYLKKNNP